MKDSVAIRTENLGKTYGRGDKGVQAVKNLNLRIRRGQVYGFLGPNGAGKTTTIRMLMDLIRPTTGSAYLFGKNVKEHHDTLKRVGAMVETPGFYGYLSGRDNLAVLAQTANQHDPRRIGLILEQVDLADKADRPVAGYSTGMKQRLGIASALLADPDLVILDEPTNGLDPAGIQEMRGFIRRLVDVEGKTVFLSSHILHEVEQVCDRVAIINKGECVLEGAVADLLGARTNELRLQVTPLDSAAEALRDTWSFTVESEWLNVTATPEDSPEIIRRLVAHGVDVHQVIVRQRSLEEFFMEVTKSA